MRRQDSVRNVQNVRQGDQDPSASPTAGGHRQSSIVRPTGTRGCVEVDHAAQELARLRGRTPSSRAESPCGCGPKFFDHSRARNQRYASRSRGNGRIIVPGDEDFYFGKGDIGRIIAPAAHQAAGPVAKPPYFVMNPFTGLPPGWDFVGTRNAYALNDVDNVMDLLIDGPDPNTPNGTPCGDLEVKFPTDFMAWTEGTKLAQYGGVGKAAEISEPDDPIEIKYACNEDDPEQTCGLSQEEQPTKTIYFPPAQLVWIWLCMAPILFGNFDDHPTGLAWKFWSPVGELSHTIAAGSPLHPKLSVVCIRCRMTAPVAGCKLHLQPYLMNQHLIHVWFAGRIGQVES